jgi:hypothetical protein
VLILFISIKLKSLKDVVIDQKTLYLVFEYVDKDLKQYLDMLPEKEFLDEMKVKVKYCKYYNMKKIYK